MKDSAKLFFNIKIMTKNVVIFCVYLQREHEISAILIEKVHIMTGHRDEKQTHKIALELGWSLMKGPMVPCKACSVWKAKE